MRHVIVSLLLIAVVVPGILVPLHSVEAAEKQQLFKDLRTGEVYQATLSTRRGTSDPVANPSDVENAKNGSQKTCGIWNMSLCIGDVLKWLIMIMVLLAAAVLSLSGVLLNVSIDEMLYNYAHYANSPAIDTTWGAFRDLGNIGIIFVLLAIAIATIVGSTSYGAKQMLARVIIIAVLLNFSLFFSKFVIEISNRVAVEFYSKITTESASVVLPGKDSGQSTQTSQSPIQKGLSGAFMNQFGLTSFYDWSKLDATLTQVRNEGLGRMFVYGMFLMIFFFIAAGAFFTAFTMLAVRGVALIFLMIASPLAFVAYALPSTQGFAKKWWSQLTNYAIFAPVFFILMWVILTLASQIAPTKSTGSFAAIFLNNGASDFTVSVRIAFHFLLLIIFMYIAMSLSKSLSLAGGSAVVNGVSKFGKGLAGGATKWGTRRAGGAVFGGAGYLGRSTLGATAANALDEKTRTGRFVGKTLTAISGLGAPGRGIASAARGGIENATKASFDLRGTGLAKNLSKQAGVDFGAAQKGGIAATAKAVRAKKDADYYAKFEDKDVRKKRAGEAGVDYEAVEESKKALETQRLEAENNIAKAAEDLATAPDDTARENARKTIKKEQDAVKSLTATIKSVDETLERFGERAAKTEYAEKVEKGFGTTTVNKAISKAIKDGLKKTAEDKRTDRLASLLEKKDKE